MALLESLPLNAAAYLEALNEFNAKLETNHSTWKCIDNCMRPLLQKFFKGHSKPFNILSMGAGDGFCDFPFIEMMTNAFGDDNKKPEFFERAVEPDAGQVNVFRANEKKFIERLQVKADFDFLPTTYQAYMNDKKDDCVKFDIVHFFHSIYYVDDLGTTLKHCYEKELSDKGVIVVHIGGPGWSKYRDTFSPMGVVLSPKSYTNHNEIIAVAKKQGWKYEECVGQEIALDVTAMFDPNSDEGNRLLNFLTQCTNIRQTANPEDLKKILDFWQTESPEDGNGKKIYKIPLKTVMIYKNM